MLVLVVELLFDVSEEELPLPLESFAGLDAASLLPPSEDPLAAELSPSFLLPPPFPGLVLPLLA